jgi:uncharacterized protein (TIGR02271 family)
MGKRIAGVFYSEQEILSAIEGLKRQGCRETDMMAVARRRSDIPLVAVQTGVMIEAEPQVNTLTGVMMDSFFTMMTGKSAQMAKGGMASGLMARGIPDFIAKQCEAETAKGKMVLLVDADSFFNTAGNPWEQYENTNETAIHLHEEKLDIQKERVQVGEMQVWKEIVETEQAVRVPLIREEIYVERRPVLEGEYKEGRLQEDEMIRIPIMEERIEVTKKPVIVEEIIIKKRKIEEMKEVKGIIKKEEARLEQLAIPVIKPDQNLEALTKAAQADSHPEDAISLSAEKGPENVKKEEKRTKRAGTTAVQEPPSKKDTAGATSEQKANQTAAAASQQDRANASASKSSEGEEQTNDRTQINKVKK